jgi:hypothetical protein
MHLNTGVKAETVAPHVVFRRNNPALSAPQQRKLALS